MPRLQEVQNSWTYDQFELNRESPRAQGLVSWFSPNAARGTNALRDLAGVVDGTLTNAPTWTNDAQVGASLSYASASSQYDNVKSPRFNFAHTDRFGIGAWVKSTDNTHHIAICGRYDGTALQGWFVSLLNGNLLLQLQQNSGTYAIRYGNSAVADGKWHWVAVTYDGSGANTGIRLYVDGVEEAYNSLSSGTLTSITNSSSFAIGPRSTVSPLYFNGQIGDLYVYQPALTGWGATVAALGTAGDASWDLFAPLKRRALAVVSTALALTPAAATKTRTVTAP